MMAIRNWKSRLRKTPTRLMRVCCLGASGLCAMLAGLASGSAAGDTGRSPSTRAVRAITQGLSFLQSDAARWRTEHKCATCHHGSMTLWALNEAKRRGYSVDAGFLVETAQWSKTSLAGIDKPRDPRPGWNMISTPALYLAVMAENQSDLDTLSTEERKQIAGHVGLHLEDDGSVLTPATMSPPRPQNGPPPVFESREILTLLAVIAMLPQKSHDPAESSLVRESRRKANAWLDSITPGDDTQAAALRLLVASKERKSARVIRGAIAGILKRQNADGGWGQLRELPSDAYATGQTLYILSLAGVNRRRPEIQRAVSFLVSNQRDDGSWPMRSRAHPGATPYTNPAPITHFGSCWAVLGLVSSAPNRP